MFAAAILAPLLRAASIDPRLSAPPPPVVLMQSEQTIAPRQAIELRFADEIIRPEAVGKSSEKAPIEIVPDIEGQWTWQSSRSGIFSPKEPWPLGHTILVRLREDLKTAKGDPLPVDWRGTVQTPAFEVQAWSNTSGRSESDAAAEPSIVLLFNADVDPQEVAASFQFVGNGGNKALAKVEATQAGRPAMSWFHKWLVPSRQLFTWAERAQGNPAFTNSTRANQLYVRPAQPLPPGDGWRLMVMAGLPAKGSTLRTLNTVEIPIGNVRPFELSQVEANNVLNQGKHLRITFSKILREKLDTAALSRWIQISPTPGKLEAKVEGSVVDYTGDFMLGENYRVTIQPGLPAAEPFVLARGSIEDVTFGPIPPRLYFEAFETHQMRGGQRKFNLLAVNTPKVRVTAKLFSGTAIPVALRGYGSYYDSPENSDEEFHTRIDEAKLPGQVVWQADLGGTSATDEQREIAMDWTEILGEGRTGVVLLTAEQIEPPAGQAKRPGTQALVQLTDIGAVWKRAPGETFLHVFSLKSGKALAGAKVRLLDDKDKTLATGKADENGIARLPATTEEARWFFVEHERDSHVIEFRSGRNYIDLARVDVSFDESEESVPTDAMRVFLFTERGVYKPGETVHLKGIVRDWRPGRAPLAGGQELALSVFDARDREFVSKKIKLSALGSFAEDIVTPKNLTGFYRAELRLVGLQNEASPLVTHEFQVEEYKPNAFEIAIGESGKEPAPGKMTLPVTAKYYMGKALSKARLNWSIEASDSEFSPVGFDDFLFCDSIENWDLRRHLAGRSYFSQSGTADLDEQGGAKIEATVPLNTKAPQPRSVDVLCEVTDVDQQTVSQSRRFKIHSSEFYLGLRSFRALLHVGEAIPIEAVAVRTDETPSPEPVAVQVQLTRIDWKTNRVETVDEATEYRSEPNFTLVTRREIKTATVTKAGDRWQFASAPIGEPIVPDRPGQYLIELSARDSAGRQVITTASLQVYGAGETAWNYTNPFQIELVPELDEYQSGDTAKILVKTPISGDALVTIEREKVLRSFMTKLEGNAPVIEVPMLPGDAPNVFVSVMLLRGADASPRKFKAPEYRIGYCELRVLRRDAKLTVYVKTGEKAYRPGDDVSVAAEVLDFQGNPVPNAEVTLFAVDEGVLSLTGYETPDPLQFFNEPRPLNVSTALTLPALLSEDPAERDFANKGYLIGGGGEMPQIRKNFLACAFWNATLRTDAKGKLAASFTAPDSLTRYRVMAVVQTARDQFGSAESSFEVNKPVMLEPALPRFANVGDKLALRAVLHNTTDLAGEAEVRVELDGTVKAETKMQRLPLAAKATVALDFPADFVETGTAVWKWSVRFTSGEIVHQDAVQSTLKVGYPVPLLRYVKTVPIETSAPNLLADVDPQLLEGRGSVRVSLTNSRAIELQEALRQLLHYPYGCVEQTTSSTLPWLTLRKLQDHLPSLQRSEDDVKSAVNRGVTRLLSMQTDGGGLSYWPGETKPMLWGSAYGSLALTLAKQQGHDVPNEEYESLMKWMSEQLRGAADVKEMEVLRQHCLVVYALAVAGRSEPAYHEVLFQRRSWLTKEDRALLALAMIESKGNTTMIDELLAEGQAPQDSSWFWSESRATALQLLCWARHKAKSPHTEALASELFNARRNGHWWTTQGNAWALLGMSDYLGRVESANKAASGQLKWGSEAASFSLGGKAQTKTENFTIKPDLARQPLQLNTSRGQRLYTEVAVEAYPPLREQPAQDRGYRLTRSYAKVADDGSIGEAKDLRVGDRIVVTLNVEVRKHAGYLAVEDPLPAIFEAVNPSFKTQQTRAGAALGADWISDYRELREDRALFFANSISPGRYTIRYLARVAAAGEVTAPSAKIEEMYAPERFGLTESIKIAAAPLH
jgi:uncharacterized protein YfaS (alpha-2-macroglobulin family)